MHPRPRPCYSASRAGACRAHGPGANATNCLITGAAAASVTDSRSALALIGLLKTATKRFPIPVALLALGLI